MFHASFSFFPHVFNYTCFHFWFRISFSTVTQLCPTLCDPMDYSTPGFPVHHQLLEFTQTHVHGVGDAIQPSHPLSYPSPPAFNFPSIMVFSNESVLHIRWPKYWSLSFSISPSNEYSGLISFRSGLTSLQCKDSGESFARLQFKSINSSVLSFLYSPTLISIHDYWNIFILYCNIYKYYIYTFIYWKQKYNIWKDNLTMNIKSINTVISFCLIFYF